MSLALFIGPLKSLKVFLIIESSFLARCSEQTKKRWLAFCSNTSLPMPKTSAIPQTFKQSPADKQRLAKAAKALGESKSLLIRAALNQFLSDLEKQNLLVPAARA